MNFSTPTLVAGEVHVWIAPTMDQGLYDRCCELLSDEEQIDIARLMVERDRRIARVSRGLRRILLGGYLGEDPASLRFSITGEGKPLLAGSSSPLRFNTSHSGELVVIALAREREVGVDVELMRKRRGRAAIARHFLSHAERRGLERLHPQRREMGFYRCWVQKEALAKLTGAGLHRPFQAFDVEVAMTQMNLPAGYVGALAVFGPTPGIRGFWFAGRSSRRQRRMAVRQGFEPWVGL